MNLEEHLEGMREIDGKIRTKLYEHSELMKRAERTDWDAAILADADARMAEARLLQKESKKRLAALEESLTEEERRRLDDLSPRTMKPDSTSRLWKQELSAKVMEPTTAVSIDDSLNQGLDKILAHIPVNWLHEQQEIGKAFGHGHLRRPLVLYGSSRADELQIPVHRFAYGVFEALSLAEKSCDYDIYEGGRLLPEIGALCLAIDALKGVRNGIAKLRELSRAPSDETYSRLFELLVAARCAELGRDVEFLNPGVTKTPDLRIYDYGFPAVLECKRQSSLAAYENREIVSVNDAFRALSVRRRKLGLVGDLQIVFNEDAERVPTGKIINAAEECVRSLNPYSALKTDWGALTFSPLAVSTQLDHETLLYSPYFLEKVFDWHGDNAEYDGLCALVENNNSMRVGRAELPFSIRWRVDKESALDRKARCVTTLLAEAIAQIPTGEGGFVYICYDDSHRAAVADRRTKRIFELARTFQVRKRGIRPPLLIVVGRLFPQPLGDGRADLIESNIPITTDEENVWDGFMPGRIFT